MSPLSRLGSRALALVMLLALASACQAPVSSWPSDAIGLISVNGSEAFLNREVVQTGAWLHEGDTLITGHATWVRVDLRQGGVVEIDQDTDPFFQDLLDDAALGRCLLVKVIFGRALIQGPGLCEEDNNQTGAMHSTVVLRTDRVSSQLLVLAGSVTLHRPITKDVQAQELLDIRPGSDPVIRRATPFEMQQATAGLRGPATRAVPIYTPTVPIPLPNDSKPSTGATTPPPRRPPTGVIGGVAKVPPSKDPPVWCCRAGSLSEVPSQVCRKERGQLYESHEQALKACQSSRTAPIQ